MLARIEEAVRPYPKAALFELAEEGFASPFEQLVACMISLRTLDEVTLPTARALLRRARTPREMARLGARAIDELIRPCTFHEPKARQIQAIAELALERYGGELPCDEQALLGLRGVGPKTANLVLGIACGVPRIGVDIHVHRITNRWGCADAPTPEATLAQLERRVPRRLWLDLNRLLVPFGKHVCTGERPRCSECPVREMCQQKGVTRWR